MAEKKTAPAPTVIARDATGTARSGSVGKALSDEEIEKNKAAEMYGSTKGANLKGVAPKTAFPKMEQGESPASFGERMRVFRETEKSAAEEGQKKALRAMKPKTLPLPVAK